VINRGLAKRALFESTDDARFFLARTVRQIRLGRLEVHAYCLLTTHFHLLVRSPIGELSEAMRRIQNEHSRRFNRKHRRDGTLVRGRFFSKPVHSLEYRQTLVRYIDANPVNAGLARAIGQYELGSAAAYLHGSGPRWLTREWVESEACLAAGTERFTPTAYRTAFATNGEEELAELIEFVEKRSSQTAAEDALADLVMRAPREVQAWMQRKARLADGHRVGLAVCGRLALRRALDEHLDARGTWMVEDGLITRRGAELAWHGLLRDLCGCTWSEIASLGTLSPGRAQRIGSAHRRLLLQDSTYAERVAEVAHAAIGRRLARLGAARRKP